MEMRNISLNMALTVLLCYLGFGKRRAGFEGKGEENHWVSTELFEYKIPIY